MATENEKSELPSNIISGKILTKELGKGIPNLLVVLFDIDKWLDPEDNDGIIIERRAIGLSTSTSSSADISALFQMGDRIGSTLTDSLGEFRFEVSLKDFNLPPKQIEQKPDLILLVLAPEEPGLDLNSRLIYFSNDIRLNAGTKEAYIIKLTPATLTKFGLDSQLDVKEAVANYKLEKTVAKEFSQGVVEFHRAEVERDFEERRVLRDDLIKTIATDLNVATFHGQIVRENESIKDKVKIVTEKAVGAADLTINGAPGEAESDGVPVNLYLLPEDRERLQPFFDAAVDGFATIPEFELLEILERTNSSENPGTLLIHNNPIASYCSEHTFEEQCAKLHTSEPDEPGHDHGDEPGGADTPDTPDLVSPQLTNANVKEIAARLTTDMRPPGFVFGDEFNKAIATQEAIDKSVGDFALGKGPADVPAFYDFVSLQIAFEHVWKVLVDEDIVNTAHEMDKTYKQKTGVGLVGGFNRSWADSLTVRGIYNSIPQEVPPTVTAQFDITLQEWIDLSASHRAKLSEIATVLSDQPQVRGSLGSIGGIIGGLVGSVGSGRPRMSMFQREKMRQDLREQGERIIDSVRHDDYYTLHKTLRDLHARINSAYEFTVFAADKNVHSVNFGLMTTYRQKWVPINYQAGKLVKTIPLSPKEERKYSVKTTRNLKLVKKEAVKNNSSHTAEQTSTSRVEAEIMEKAQNKTNFGLSTEGTYNIGISKGKATTTFGVEAQNESSANRKDFREAVLKATQEYKDERTMEIDTEESSSYEYNESGTIVNPNDELSVTYLFYELQRRYRIWEQLYRVLPVVMVAQEVPAPHEITEAWVIANDWIINRYLLDDSFRPALHYLANKSVGDDFALRELRKNLRQQRNLVETLRIELSISSNEAENRYRALENAIQRRIEEESAERTDGLFSDIGDFFGGGGQDPEAMKARELAAKDAHQYAAEKAGKAAVAMRQEVNNLHTLTSEYNSTLRNHLDNETRVKRLLSHLRGNMSYYLQGIWSMEPPDQRYLRLHKVEVPVLKLATITDPNTGKQVANRTYQVNIQEVDDIFASFRKEGTKKFKAFVKGVLMPANSFAPKALVEIGDLDNLLGFKGNYMIFPMKEHNALTEFMAAPFVDEAFGAMDPDEISNVSLDDYAKFICCLHHTDPAEFERLKPELKKWLERLLADPLRNGDEIVIPTGSLFIESLVGTYPLLESFKRRHREMDAYKVAEEVRKAQMENLRLAARLVNEEREDPDIEKKIVIEGNAGPVIDVDN